MLLLLLFSFLLLFKLLLLLLFFELLFRLLILLLLLLLGEVLLRRRVCRLSSPLHNFLPSPKVLGCMATFSDILASVVGGNVGLGCDAGFFLGMP